MVVVPCSAAELRGNQVATITEWLVSLGLSEYAQRFADNRIDDVSILRDLTDQDLKDIGVPLGHRRKMLRGIAEMVGAAAIQIQSAPAPAPEPKPWDDAERRQLTVMFTDLVGSTALSTKLDPEDLRSVIGAYHKCVAQAVARFDGFVAKYMGDGVLVYFGYPHAHEDDAERAVRAGLALAEAMGKLGSEDPLQVRVGIATGLVVVGDLVGSGEAQERGILGETPNVAARLQGIAEPNMVVIAEGTRKLLGNLFELHDLGPMDLKGIAGPVRAFAALRARSVESRFEALHATGLTALVGREEECELLLRRWSRAKTGEGQVVLISGEAGIGKSRLTAALLQHLGAEPHTRLRYFCSPQHTDSALYPIIGQMARAAGLAHDDAPQARLDKLDHLLAQTSTSIEDTALFAEMLSLANDGRYPALDLVPEQRRQRTLEALTAQLARLANLKPVLMIFEDAHWIDPTSLEALGRIVGRIKALQALLIVTFRPEFNSPWVGQSQVTSLILNRLGERDAAAIITHLVANKGLLAADVIAAIVERTDGIPLFVEEMTKGVLEAGGEGVVERALTAVPSPVLAVPASLHASLMARLDRLGPAKEVAQTGAAIGREFSYALLVAVVGNLEGKLRSGLDRLVKAGLLFQQGEPPHATYLFKHALLQDAAYGTLLREVRRVLHARIADALEAQYPEIAETQPELLAHHCTEAGLLERAANLWGKAGHRSLGRSALVEAAEQLTRALTQIATLASTPRLRSEEIKLQVALANALMHRKGYAAPETKAALDQARSSIERAEERGERLADPLMLFSVLFGVWNANIVAFSGNVVRELAAQILALAERKGGRFAQMMGHRVTASSLLLTGAIADARSHFNRAIALYDPAEHRSLATRFGQDARVSSLSFRSWNLWFLGYPDAALADVDRALADAREIGVPTTLMFALFHVTLTHLHCGNYAMATALNDELAALSDEKGSLHWQSSAQKNLGCILALSGDALGASQALVSVISAADAAGYKLNLPFNWSCLARVHLGLGQSDDARRCIAEALTITQTTKEGWAEAELHRIMGEIAWLSPEHDAATAQACFERARAIAREQQAKSWELRVAMSMARLWRDQGKRRQAHDLLAPVYGWFTEGFETLDLKEAKALLDELT
jgi:class 3 adenylate cyclase/predicted ATPase